jgi:antitoxin component of RelBE/YafQ-DinJ toxin-antitoxin module
MKNPQERRVLKSSDDAVVTISLAGESFAIKNAFIGGREVDGDNPIGMYSGVLDIAEMGLSLLSMFRAILRTTRQELGMPVDVAEDFILFCLSEALKKETAEEKIQAVEDFVNKYFKNHY